MSFAMTCYRVAFLVIAVSFVYKNERKNVTRIPIKRAFGKIYVSGKDLSSEIIEKSFQRM